MPAQLPAPSTDAASPVPPANPAATATAPGPATRTYHHDLGFMEEIVIVFTQRNGLSCRQWHGLDGFRRDGQANC